MMSLLLSASWIISHRPTGEACGSFSANNRSNDYSLYWVSRHRCSPVYKSCHKQVDVCGVSSVGSYSHFESAETSGLVCRAIREVVHRVMLASAFGSLVSI